LALLFGATGSTGGCITPLPHPPPISVEGILVLALPRGRRGSTYAEASSFALCASGDASVDAGRDQVPA
jgi:hypothetical protein